jgi:hypothetical protein
MASAIIGLVGALLGAVTTLFGALLTEHRQARREERKWRRDQRSAAYDGALRHLLRAANLRSEFAGGQGVAILKQEHQREWFDDLVQAQFWLHAATRHCDTAQLGGLTEAAGLLDTYVARLNSGERFDGKGFSILQVLQTCISTVTDCARRDGGHTGIPGQGTHEEGDPSAGGRTGPESPVGQIATGGLSQIPMSHAQGDFPFSNIAMGGATGSFASPPYQVNAEPPPREESS